MYWRDVYQTSTSSFYLQTPSMVSKSVEYLVQGKYLVNVACILFIGTGKLKKVEWYNLFKSKYKKAKYVFTCTCILKIHKYSVSNILDSLLSLVDWNIRPLHKIMTFSACKCYCVVLNIV